MINDIKKDAQSRMQRSIDSFKTELAKLRTGRAHPSLLDHLSVDYYGNPTPLNQVANISVVDPRTLGVTPWEKAMVQVVEKAIMNSDLGLNPATVGNVIRVPMPSLTEQRRRDLIRVVGSEAEGAKVAVRNIRRDANNDLKDLLKEKTITEDEERSGQEAIQKLTDNFVKEIETLQADKETDLMQV